MPLYDELEGAPGAGGGLYGAPQKPRTLLEMLATTWPARLAQGVGHGLGMFGRAAAGKLNVRDEEGRISPEVIAGMTDVAGAMPMAGMPFAMKGAAGIFGGRLAEGANLKMLRKAERLEEGGAKRDDIWRATGWGRDTEGNWFFEIPDNKARVHTGKLLKHDEPSMLERIAGKREGGDERAPLTLGQGYSHPALFKAYPELADTPLRTPTLPRAYAGGVNAKGDINLSRDLLEIDKSGWQNEYGWTPKNVLTHELQHKVQTREGFPNGGNPKAIAESTYNDIKQRFDAAAPGSEERTRLGAMLDQFKVGEGGDIGMSAEGFGRAFNVYERIAGETQARNAQRRVDLTPAERRTIPPWSTEDVPAAQQIIPALPERQMGLPFLQGRKQEVAAPAIKEADAPLFDYSRLRDVPDVPQFGLDRYVPPRGVPESALELADKKNVARVNKVVKQGAEMGGLEWYNTEPLRQAFIDELGASKGGPAYQQYLDLVAATSPRSNVGTNARNASYYYSLAQRGEPLPQAINKGGALSVDRELPSPYGHIAQGLHAQNANNVVHNGGWPVLQNPKPASFAQNLAGNQMPVTIDTHNMRLLTGAMDEIKPKSTEYGFLEQLQQQQANKLGMSPAQYQASAWVGGGAQTGLRSTADPFLKVFEDRVTLTADKAGLSKQEVLRRFIRGDMPLLEMGAPLPVAGGLYGDD